jgi:toxin YoeB
VSTYRVDFTPEASKTISKFKKSNPNLYKKLVRVLDDIMKHPKTGVGHPESLAGGGGVIYSRRIASQHRIIYDVYEDEIRVLVLTVEGHYDDK